MLDSLQKSVQAIQSMTNLKPRVGITLGSGLASFSKALQIENAIPYKDIPGFSPTTVDGHPGQLILGYVGAVPVAVLQGRIHYYEGHSMLQVVHPTRVLAVLGIESLILTNAAGGLDPQMQPGDFMIITDHINLTGDNPLKGKNVDQLGPRFPDMSQAYDPLLIEKLEGIMQKKSVRYSKGVYCGVTGPSYETKAEIKYLRTIGGSAVGMSTVPETIAAVHLGLRVCGISCITNMGAGMVKKTITHEDVKEVTTKVETQFCDFLYEFVLGF